MSMEYLVERNENGQILKFVGSAGTFYDVWGADREYLGTCGSVPEAIFMQCEHNNPQDNPEDISEVVLKSS